MLVAAETLAHVVGHVFESYWGFEMTPAQHARICPLIHDMATRYEAATAADPSVLGAVAVP